MRDVNTQIEHERLDKDDSKDEINIAFLVCDEPTEKTLKKHGGFDDMLHNLLEPLIQKEHPNIDLVVKGYDVGRPALP